MFCFVRKFVFHFSGEQFLTTVASTCVYDMKVIPVHISFSAMLAVIRTRVNSISRFWQNGSQNLSKRNMSRNMRTSTTAVIVWYTPCVACTCSHSIIVPYVLFVPCYCIAAYRRTQKSSLQPGVRVDGHLALTDFRPDGPKWTLAYGWRRIDSTINIVVSIIIIIVIIIIGEQRLI